jgi:hypothetical protein
MNTIHYCIQCTDKNSGEIGCFAYDREAYERGEGFKAITEVFPSLIPFFDWAHKEGYVFPRNYSNTMTKG